MKLKIEVLGKGTPKSKEAGELFAKAAKELKVDADVVHVDKMSEIINRNVTVTPAVYVNGKKVAQGDLPEHAQAVSILKDIIEWEKAE